MNNQPFDPNTLSPVEQLLLGRLNALESFTARLGGIFSEHSPAARNAIQQSGMQSSLAVVRAQEDAAAIYLHTVTDPLPAGVQQEPWTLAGLHKASEEAVTAINEALAQYLPLAGLTHALGELPFPVALPANVFLRPWKKPIQDETTSPAAFLELVLKHKNAVVYESALIHPMGGVKEPLIVLPNIGHHLFVLAPLRGQWMIATFPSGLDHVFFHRQARVLDVDKVVRGLKDAFVTQQDPAVRALLREHSDAETTIQVLAANVFESGRNEQVDVVREGLFTLRAVHGQHPRLGRIITVAHAIDDERVGMELVFTPANPKHAVIVTGDQVIPTAFDQLKPVTKNLLIEALTALAKKVKPPKTGKAVKDRVTATKKAVSKRQTTRR
jgi:hypothetical protein